MSYDSLKLTEDLEKLRFGLEPSNGIIFHPTLYAFIDKIWKALDSDKEEKHYVFLGKILSSWQFNSHLNFDAGSVKQNIKKWIEFASILGLNFPINRYVKSSLIGYVCPFGMAYITNFYLLPYEQRPLSGPEREIRTEAGLCFSHLVQTILVFLNDQLKVEVIDRLRLSKAQEHDRRKVVAPLYGAISLERERERESERRAPAANHKI